MMKLSRRTIAEQEKFQQTAKECYDCHQMGSQATREFAPYVQGATYARKVGEPREVRPVGSRHGVRFFQRFGDGRQSLCRLDATASRRGETPKTTPPRPAGVQRNLVISLWDWGTPIDGRADNVRRPTCAIPR